MNLEENFASDPTRISNYEKLIYAKKLFALIRVIPESEYYLEWKSAESWQKREKNVPVLEQQLYLPSCWKFSFKYLLIELMANFQVFSTLSEPPPTWGKFGMAPALDDILTEKYLRAVYIFSRNIKASIV